MKNNKTIKYLILDGSIPHGRYAPVDNVIKVSYEILDYHAPEQMNLLWFKRAIEILNDVINNYSLTLSKITIDIKEHNIVILGMNEDKKILNIEIKKAPIC